MFLFCEIFQNTSFFMKHLRITAFAHRSTVKYTEMYSDPHQTTKMELLTKIINGLTTHYFCGKLHLKC